MVDMKELAGLTQAQLIERLLAAQAAIPKPGVLTFKVGEKGGIMVTGVGRFPVTLYPEQWIKVHSFTTGLPVVKLLDMPILKFIQANKDNGLSFKSGIPELNIPAGYGKQAPAAPAK